MSNPPAAVAVSVNRGAAIPAPLPSFDAVIAALEEFEARTGTLPSRIEARPLTEAERALAARFAGELEAPRTRRKGARS